MPVTQKDIARIAGVNQSTVSRILRNDPKAVEISEEVRKKVLKIAKEEKYSSNVSAATMRQKFNRSTVALICSGNENVGRSYHIFLFRLIRQLNELSYGVRIYSSGDYESIFREIAANQIYYVVCAQNTEENFLKIGKLCLQYKVKAIFNSAKQYFPEIPVFADDDRANIRIMVRHLYEKGHRRIGFVTGGVNSISAHKRLDACREEMKELSLPCPEESFYYGEYSVDSFLDYVKTIQPTALCCMDPGIGALAENALLRAGFRIPHEISMIVYGSPALTDPGHSPQMSHVERGFRNTFPAIREYLFTERSEKHACDYTRFSPGILVEGDTVMEPRKGDFTEKFKQR